MRRRSSVRHFYALFMKLDIFRYDSSKRQGAKKELVETDGLTVALLVERRAQQGRPLRKVQIELCRSEHGHQIGLQIDEVELSDRHLDEDHFQDHLDGVWPTKIRKTWVTVYHFPTHAAFCVHFQLALYITFSLDPLIMSEKTISL